MFEKGVSTRKTTSKKEKIGRVYVCQRERVKIIRVCGRFVQDNSRIGFLLTIDPPYVTCSALLHSL